MSNIQPYRHDRLRQLLVQRTAKHPAIVRRDTEILYPQPMQSSEIQQHRLSPSVSNPSSSSSIENRFGLAVVIFAIGASVALVILSIGGMVSSIAQSGADPKPSVWIRNEQIRSQ